MEPFGFIDAVAMPIERPNFDTDQILPARYLQKPRAHDFGEYLFRDLRYRKDGSLDPDFALNRAAYGDARIVVAGRNFGCGSSREHAVWALHDYGFRAAIAPSFGDIFASNALKNGFLPIVLPEETVSDLIAKLRAQPGLRLAIDLEAQAVTGPGGERHAFAIDPFSKRCLREGLDELGYTLTQLDRIEAFERAHPLEST